MKDTFDKKRPAPAAMGVLLPDIPYKSQYDPDASEFRNDCGPASIAMVLNASGKQVSTNAVYRKTGAVAHTYVSIGQMMRAAHAYGIVFEYFYGWGMEELKNALRKGMPVIPLVHYGAWSQIEPGVSTQNLFTGPHFVVVIGWDEEYVYVHDPLWRDERRSEGERKKWTHAEFMNAWGSAHNDGNRDFSCIVSTHVLPVKTWGIEEKIEELPPVYQIDPVLFRRMAAWASFFGIPLPEINNPAVATAYQEAMGSWGERQLEHKVTENDTLGLIALKYYNDPLKFETILKFNGMSLSDPIFDGDLLFIPEPLEEPGIIPPENIPQGGTNEFRLKENEAAVRDGFVTRY